MKNKNYWFQTCPTKHNVSSGLVRNADVLIIGGGIAGMSLLYQLINSGVTNAYLVEESTVGFHASGRSSGQLMLRGAKLFHEYGEKDGAEYLNFISENNKRFLNGLRKVPFDTDLRDGGGLRLAADDKEMESLVLESKFLRKHRDLDCPVLDKKDIADMLPKSNFVGGMYVPTEATFNPYKVTNGLRELIDNKGSRVMTDCQVLSVTQEEKALAVSIRHKGIIKAKKVVYATNAYTSELLPEFAEVMTPYRGQMIATSPLGSIASQAIPAMSMSSSNCDEYFRLYNGRLLVGGKRNSVRGKQKGIINDGEISPGIHDKLRGFVMDILPSTKDIKFTHAWSGIMCATPDGLPFIGQVPGKENEYVLGGFNGYGYCHSLQGSTIIKDLILSGHSKSPGAELFNPARIL